MVFLIVARVAWGYATRVTHGVLVKRLRHRPFTAVTWVQLPYTSPHTKGVRPGVAKTSRHGEMVLHLPSIRRLVRFRPRTSIMQHWCSGSTSAFQADGTGSIPVCCSTGGTRKGLICSNVTVGTMLAARKDGKCCNVVGTSIAVRTIQSGLMCDWCFGS